MSKMLYLTEASSKAGLSSRWFKVLLDRGLIEPDAVRGTGNGRRYLFRADTLQAKLFALPGRKIGRPLKKNKPPQ